MLEVIRYQGNKRLQVFSGSVIQRMGQFKVLIKKVPHMMLEKGENKQNK